MDYKKGFISISIVYTFLILFIFLMLAILASYISRENLLSKIVNQSKEIIYKEKNKNEEELNVSIKVYIDGIYSKLFPSNEFYTYNQDTSYCTNGALIEFDDELWDASVSNIKSKTNCIINFVRNN